MLDKSLLEKLVRVPSFFPEELNFSLFLDKFIKKEINCQSYHQKISSKRQNLLYTKGSGKKVIMLVGHMDTVPVVDGWSTNPFEPITKNNRLYGLGSWDMKAGIYIILQCLKKFQPKNITLKAAFTVDEENYSVGAHKLIDSGKCNDVEFVLIPEPGFEHGEFGITIGRTGRVTYVIKIVGKSAHGNNSGQGINAINQAMTFINEILKIKFVINERAGKTEIFPRAFNSVAKGFSVPDEAEIELDCKLIAPDTPESVLEKINKKAQEMFRNKELSSPPKISFKQRPTPFCAPYEVSGENKYYKICKKSAEEMFGKVKNVYNDSVADECIFVSRLKIPAICIGPKGANAHKADEYVDLSSLEKVERLYLKILEEIDKN